MRGVVGTCWTRREGFSSYSPGLIVSGLEWLPCTGGSGLWGALIISTDLDWVEQLEGNELGCTRPLHKAWLLFLCALYVSVMPSVWKEM